MEGKGDGKGACYRVSQDGYCGGGGPRKELETVLDTEFYRNYKDVPQVICCISGTVLCCIHRAVPQVLYCTADTWLYRRKCAARRLGCTAETGLTHRFLVRSVVKLRWHSVKLCASLIRSFRECVPRGMQLVVSWKR